MPQPVFIDLQVSTDGLLALVRNQMRAQRVCLTESIPPFDLYLDHVEVPTADGFLDGADVPSPGGLVRRSASAAQWTMSVSGVRAGEQLDVHHPQIVVPVQLHLTSDAMLAEENPPLHTAGTVVALVFTVWGEMDRDEDPWQPRLLVQATDIDFMALDDVLSDPDKALVSERLDGLGAVKLPISLGPVTGLLGDPPPPITNVGVSIDVSAQSAAEASRLAVRWELGGPASSIGSWDDFLNDGSLGSAVQAAGEWSFVLPAPLLTTLFDDGTQDFLQNEQQKPADQQKFEVLDWPSTSWIWWLNAVATTFDLDILTPGPCLNDIGVTVKLLSQLGVAADGRLQVTTDVTWDAYDSDVALCAIQTGVTGDPTATFTSTIVSGVVAASYDPNLNQYELGVPGFDCQWQNSTTLVCSRAVPSPVKGASLALTSIQAQPAGAVLAGTMSVAELPPPGSLKVLAEPFDWIFGNICETFDRVVVAQIAWVSVPVKHCVSPEVVDDPLGQFAPFLAAVELIGKTEVRVEVPESGILSDYLSDPYPCRVRLRTDARAAQAEVPPLEPPPELPDPVVLLGMREQECGTFTNWPMDQIEILPQDWWTDPPPDGAVVEHGWQVLVSGLPAGRSFAVLDAQDRLVGFSTAGARTLGVVAATMSPDLGAQATLTNWPPDGPGAMRARPAGASAVEVKVAIEQTLLLQTAHLPLDGACRDLGVCGRENRDVAWCVTGNGLRIYDITRALAEPAASFDHPGLTGAQALDPGRFLAWGPAGLVLLDEPAGDGSYAPRWISNDPVLAAAHRGAWTYVLVPDAIEVLDREMRRTARTQVVDGWHLAATARRLVVAAENRITPYALDDPREPAPGSSLQVRRLEALAAARIPGHPDAVVVADRQGRAQVVDMGQLREPRVLATTEPGRDGSLPATVGTPTSVVRRGADRASLEAFQVADRRLLTRAQLEARQRANGS